MCTMEKIGTSVLLKLSINGNEICHANNNTKRIYGSLFSNTNNKQSMFTEEQKLNYIMM